MSPKPAQQTLDLALPTSTFRRDSWKSLQLKLDPLALPRPLPVTQP